MEEKAELAVRCEVWGSGWVLPVLTISTRLPCQAQAIFPAWRLTCQLETWFSCTVSVLHFSPSSLSDHVLVFYISTIQIIFFHQMSVGDTRYCIPCTVHCTIVLYTVQIPSTWYLLPPPVFDTIKVVRSPDWWIALIFLSIIVFSVTLTALVTKHNSRN